MPWALDTTQHRPRNPGVAPLAAPISSRSRSSAVSARGTKPSAERRADFSRKARRSSMGRRGQGEGWDKLDYGLGARIGISDGDSRSGLAMGVAETRIARLLSGGLSGIQNSGIGIAVANPRR